MLEVRSHSQFVAPHTRARRRHSGPFRATFRRAIMMFGAVLCALSIAGCVADISESDDKPFPNLGEFPPVPETTPPEAWDTLEKSLTADRQGSQDEQGTVPAVPLPRPAAGEGGAAGKPGR
jgi:hypothetical protein